MNRPFRRWTEEEDNGLREMAPEKRSVPDMAKEFKRSVNAIYMRGQKLDLAFSKAQQLEWIQGVWERLSEETKGAFLEWIAPSHSEAVYETEELEVPW